MSNLELAVRQHFDGYSANFLATFSLGEIMQSFFWNSDLEDTSWVADTYEVASDASLSSEELTEFEEIYSRLIKDK